MHFVYIIAPYIPTMIITDNINVSNTSMQFVLQHYISANVYMLKQVILMINESNW